MCPTQWIYAILGLLLLVISNNAQTCSNDLPGVESSGACCVADCATCGGSGCGDRARDAGLSGGDCCVGAIRDAGVYCDDSMAAPYLIGSDSEGNICESNGLPGIEVSGICCAPGCLQCGGVGCGIMAPNVGLTSADCCIGPITSAGVLCDDSGMAPCIIGEPSTCSNGVFGVEADGACCVTQCGTCGGVGCSSRAAAAGLTADDCCVGRIRDSGVSCDDTMEAPCLIDVVPIDDMCSNGIPGIETSGVCCVATCPQCGGVGCGSMASTVGLDSGDCCVGVIMSAGESCDDTMMAPCVIDDDDDIDGVFGPALTITLEWSDADSDLDLYVTEPGGEVVRFANMVGDVGFLDMDAREGPGIETYTFFSGLNSVDVIGTYQLQARRFTGSTETIWTLTVSLIEDVVLDETGDFVDDNNLTASRSNIFTVAVTAYDSNCEDGTAAFPAGSRESTSSPEDKLP